MFCSFGDNDGDYFNEAVKVLLKVVQGNGEGQIIRVRCLTMLFSFMAVLVVI